MRRADTRADGAFISLLRRMNIYKRLIVFFLLLIIVPDAVIAVYASTVSANKINRDIVNGAEQVMNNVVTIVNDKLRAYETMAIQIEYSPGVRELLTRCYNEWTAGDPRYDEDRSSLVALLAQYHLVYPNCELEIATQYDDYSDETLTGSRGLQRLKLRDSAAFFASGWYEEAVRANGAPVWIDTSKITDNILMQFTPSELSGSQASAFNMSSYLTLLCDIPYARGFCGAIIIVVPVQKTLYDITELHGMYDPSEMVLLLSGSGIVSVLNNNVFLGHLPDNPMIQELVSGGQSARILNNNGLKQLYVTVPLGKMDMAVAYVASQKAVNSGTDRLVALMVIVAGVCLVIGLIAMYLITFSIARPVRRLEDVMNRAAGERMEITYQDSGQDEIGRLGAIFNDMLKHIRMLISSLMESEQARHAERTRRREAEFNALQMQINPHFLYNTLDLIHWNTMYLENGNGATSRMITEFSKLLRMGTYNTGQSATIREELEHVRAYVNVINFRKEFHIELAVHIDPERLLEVTTVRFTLQPIVENAVRHGFRDRDKGSVRIDVQQDGVRAVRVVVEDNGAGMTGEQLRALRESLQSNEAYTGKGVALRNISERMELRFGAQDRILLESEPGAYTRVILLIPQEYDEPG